MPDLSNPVPERHAARSRVYRSQKSIRRRPNNLRIRKSNLLNLAKIDSENFSGAFLP